LSETGFYEAARITRNHRLWELYLIEHADIAPNRVDQDADRVEHILGIDMVRDLERKLDKKSLFDPVQLPASPHPIHPVN
jgi:manganese/zinc/iron transport system permease protein